MRVAKRKRVRACTDPTNHCRMSKAWVPRAPARPPPSLPVNTSSRVLEGNRARCPPPSASPWSTSQGIRRLAPGSEQGFELLDSG